jgi:hypothetical protein
VSTALAFVVVLPLTAAVAIWCLYLHRTLMQLRGWVADEAVRVRAHEVELRRRSRANTG